MVTIPWRALLLVPLLLGAVLAQDPKAPETRVDDVTGFLPRTITVAGKEHRYAVFVPKGYRPAERWPLLLFLHGMGESGTDGTKQTQVGLGAAIRADEQRWPFVVLFPQKPDRASQWTDHEPMVLAILAEAEATYSIDPKRRFLTGLSQGGAGTWALGSKHAEKWAAIAPVCGYGTLDGASAAKLKTMPIWAFHGVDDPVVPVQQSKDLCAAVTAAGGEPALTLYENTKHNSWDKAYRDSALAEWFELARSEPWAAACLAAPQQLGELELRIENRDREQGTRVIVLHKVGETFRCHDGTGAAGIAVDRAAGEAALARCVRVLAQGGALAALANGPVDDWPAAQARVTITLRGSSGERVRVARFVPSKDAGRADAVDRAMEVLRTLR